jgi:hypothetical protein
MFTLTSSYLRQSKLIRGTALLGIVTAVGMTLSLGSEAIAHDEFKDVLERRYRLKSVSCKACHTDNKDKKIRNAFGKLLDRELKEKKLTERYQSAKDEGEDAKKRFEKIMVKEFSVALSAIEKKPVTFLALMEAGLLNGTRLDKNQVDVDTLTIKTLTDREVEELKIENSSLIEGEVKQMPSDELNPSPEKEETGKVDSDPPSKLDASGANTVAEPKPNDSKADKPNASTASDHTDEPK